jgi:hypothetical protein
VGLDEREERTITLCGIWKNITTELWMMRETLLRWSRWDLQRDPAALRAAWRAFNSRVRTTKCRRDRRFTRNEPLALPADVKEIVWRYVASDMEKEDEDVKK